MHQYNFDETIDRKGTDSYKWDRAQDLDWLIPMPVADMDFKCAMPIVNALNDIVHHGIYGYSDVPAALAEQIVIEQKKKYNWDIKPEWIVWLPGLVPGLGAFCRAFGEAGQKVLCPTPIYHHFHLSIALANLQIQASPLIIENNRYTLDFDQIEQSINGKTKLFMLCNPQNPGGNVFNINELYKIADLCVKNNLIICSDEIHAEILIDKSVVHIPIASLNPAIEQLSVTLISPSKTYNIAGLGCSAAIIPNIELRKKFERFRSGIIPSPNRFSFQAALVAYRDCTDWKEQMLAYIRQNHYFLLDSIQKLKGVKMLPLEATYLAWLDFREADIANLDEKLVKNGLRLSPGGQFLADGFMRMNFASPKIYVERAVERITKTLLEG